ncbi:unnamed protein product [Phytophthora lilii]|uniref:Unnamed protein product n=1 Tax=Phytophthora lilii TaxID=2077276 RepID=A0A9W6U7Q8_9STRA|nr:unnamed protein product [Phytophthora lilii]
MESAAGHGVRRRREEPVEIEELDSRTMRQSSYNFFQQSWRASPRGRKRQRTLAEQLDELCLQGPRRRKSRRHKSRVVELDELGRDKAPALDGSSSDSDVMTDAEPTLQVYGDAAGGLRGFFAAGAHRPMDRMYRHYVAVAQAAATAPAPRGNELVVFRPPVAVDTSFTDDLPAYLSLTPHEFEKLSMAEKRQWYQAHRRYMKELDQAAAEQKNEQQTDTQLEAKPTDETGGGTASRRRSSSASSSRSYQVLGVPSTDEEDDGVFDDIGEDVEMMEDIEDDAAPKRPHAAGALTHSEWFTDDEL